MKQYEEIKQDILGRINTVNTNEGSFADVTVSPVSLEIEKNYTLLDHLYGNMFLENLSSEELEKKAEEYGIVRKEGTKTTGQVDIQGLKDTTVPADTLVATGYGLNYLTTEELIFAEDGILTVDIIAEDIGTKYNVAIGAIDNLPISVNGVVSVTNATATTGGTNVETDTELLDRLLLRLRTPATSGNALHYKTWAMEVDGIADAKVFPLWAGNGTVQVVPITVDKRVPDTQLIHNVVTKIEEERPIGATVTVTAPDEIDINVNATITLKLNADIQKIKQDYIEKLTEYIEDSVFCLDIVDYNKCLSIFYTISGVESVTDFKINDSTNNIAIGEKQIQVVGTVDIEGDING